MRPIDADELRDRFLARAKRAENDCMPMTAAEMMLVARDIDRAPTVELPGWVSVKDRLPDVDQRVIVSLVDDVDGHRVKQALIGYTVDPAGNSWFITTWKEWLIDCNCSITHWMPLPEPPEEVSRDG